MTAPVVWRVRKKESAAASAVFVLVSRRWGAIASQLYVSKQMESLREEGKGRTQLALKTCFISRNGSTREADVLLILGRRGGSA